MTLIIVFLKRIWKFVKVSNILFFVIVGIFIYLSARADIIDYFSRFIQNNIFGVAIYIFIFALVTVVAPLTMLPLVIPSSVVFGPFFTGIYSIIGWTIGAIIAFLIARYIGKPFLSKFVSLKHIEEYDKYFSGNVEFWTLVFLRMMIPVDILSYAVGFLSRISFKKYLFATIIGITPFAFIFSYLGDAFVQKQYIMLIALSVSGIFLFGFIYIVYKIYHSNRIK